MSEIASFIRDMNEVAVIIALALISVVLECFKLSFDLSISNILIFINLLGIYYILNNIRVNVNITYR